MSISLLVLLALMPAPAPPQQIDLGSLEPLAARAENSIDIDLDASAMHWGSMLLSDEDEEESAAKAVISGLVGIRVRVLNFDTDDGYRSADLDGVRSQLQSGTWNRLIAISDNDEEQMEVWAHRQEDTLNGLFVLVAKPDKLAVVNLIGAINLEGLRSLAGKFGIPEGIGGEIE